MGGLGRGRAGQLKVDGGVREVLLHPERWRICGTGDAGDLKPLSRISAERRQWSQENAHSHSSTRDIFFCLAGEGYFGMGGEIYACSPGHLFIIEPGIPHDNYYPESANGMEHLWLRFFGSKVGLAWLRIEQGQLRQLNTQASVFDESELGISIAAHLQAMEGKPPAFRSARWRLLMGVIAWHLAERLEYPASLQASQAARESLAAEVVGAVRRHIEETAGREATLDFLAHFSGYSKYHLLKIFHKRVGCTIHQYIDQERVKRLQSLREKGSTNSAIANDLGFSSPTSFLRWRRKLKAS